jgi:LAO/AO transport system kinase
MMAEEHEREHEHEHEQNRPEWVPRGGGRAFTTHVLKGVEVEGGHDGMPRQPAHSQRQSVPERTNRRRKLSVEDYVQGVLHHDRTILARTITLIESNAHPHIETAQEVLRQLLPHTGQSIRVGITGVPGVGKSTFIEALGCLLCEQGHRVAVLAVDPSSSVTGGSILGDKTRMERLSREPAAFIRPSPAGGTLGGVTRKSRETILVCEAGGFDVILVETVGVGQSEATVRSMTDFFLLLVLTGAGDELQGIKKGVMELADAIVVNKADGDNKARAIATSHDYNHTLHYLAPATEGWDTRAYTCSSRTGEGIADIWGVVEDFRHQMTASGVLAARRRSQTRDWVQAMIEEHLKTRFFRHPAVQNRLPQIEEAVVGGAMPAAAAVQELLEVFEGA